MSIAYSRKRYNLRLRFLLLYLIFSLIIIKINTLAFAQQEGQRDPFISLGDMMKLTKKDAPDISTLPYPVVISGIIWTENCAVAIINNDIVQEKEKWRDFIVEKIEKDKVILRLGETKFEIPWVSEEDAQKKN